MLRGFENGVSIMIDRHRDAIFRDYPPHKIEIPLGILLLSKEGIKHFTGSVIDGTNESHPGSSTL